MAQLTLNEFTQFNQKQTSTNTSQTPSVWYFSLADDGDFKIVRFNVKSLEDIKITSKHRVKAANGKIRNVQCLRTSAKDDLNICPLCANGEHVSFKIFIPLLSYEQDTENNVTLSSCLWEQSSRMIETLKSFLMDYGDLRDYLFKIVRHGKHGDTNTTYTILPANPNIYKEEVFKKDFTAFSNLDFTRFVASVSAEDMRTFLTEGDFPNPYIKKTNTQIINQEKPQSMNSEFTTERPVSRVVENQTNWEQPQSTEVRTRRYTY